MYTEEDIVAHQAANQAMSECNKKLNERVTEIVNVIAEAFGKKKNPGWHWLDDGDGDSGPSTYDLYNNDHETQVSFCMPHGGKYETDSWDYSQGFPKKFLFMKDEDIKAHILKEIEKTAQNKQKKLEQTLLAKEKKTNIAKKALEKLTPEERQALGLK
jgi:hypothetical protein